MWDLFDELTEGFPRLRENATVLQLFCMLAILVVLVACGYMAFGKGQYVWLAGGAAVVLILGLAAVLLGKLDPH